MMSTLDHIYLSRLRYRTSFGWRLCYDGMQHCIVLIQSDFSESFHLDMLLEAPEVSYGRLSVHLSRLCESNTCGSSFNTSSQNLHLYTRPQEAIQQANSHFMDLANMIICFDA